MRKSLPTFLTVLFFAIWFFPTALVSTAENEIRSIELAIELQEDGSAKIHENREMETNEDTEIYIELSNLGESELLDFEVEGFTEEEDWNLDASFEEKANKYGIIEKEDAYELAWGISDYGLNHYKIDYHLSDLVRNLEDGQALFWNFDSFLSFPTDELKLTIQTDFALEEELLDYYAFGFEGPMRISEEGVFEWTGEDLDESNDITVLLQFPENTFQASVAEEMTLEEQKEMALEGSSYNESGPMPLGLKIFIGLLVLIGSALGLTGITYLVQKEKIIKEQDHFQPLQFMKENKESLSKETPVLEGAYENYAWLISKVSLAGGGFSEFFFLYLLIWSAEERIKLHSYEEKGFFGEKEKSKIAIQNFEEEAEVNILDFKEYRELFEWDESSFEEVIWGMLLELADEEGQVDGKDIEKWSQKHAKGLQEVIEHLEERSEDWLEAAGYLNTFSVAHWSGEIEIEQLTAQGEKLALEMLAYRNFLKQLKDAELEEQEDWEELMVWSVLFGLAEETVEQLKELDPSQFAYLEEQYPYYYGNYSSHYYLYSRSNQGLAAAGYSGGAGGMSSAGGGAGAGGGGGGGSR